MARRQRLSSDTRRAQLIAAAIPLILEQGHLPIPLDKLAKSVGASKALIYSYFPTQYDLCNAVLAQGFQELESDGLVEAANAPDLDTAAWETARIYFRHVARSGPYLHYILRDMFMAGRLSPEVAAARDRIARPLARAARKVLRLPAQEAVAALNLTLTLPEETGRLVWQGVLTLEVGETLLKQLVASSIKALRPE